MPVPARAWLRRSGRHSASRTLVHSWKLHAKKAQYAGQLACLMWFVSKVTLAARIAAEGRGIVAVVNKLDTLAPHSRQQVCPNACSAN